MGCLYAKINYCIKCKKIQVEIANSACLNCLCKQCNLKCSNMYSI